MSRLRTLKPGFFRNEELADCDPLARILFAGLWTEADRDGRLEDRPRRLKVELLPYDECDVDALLQQLHEHGFIIRYVVDGTGYIAIPQWYAHQKPHQKEKACGYPEPPKKRRFAAKPGKVGDEPGKGMHEPGCLMSLGSGNLSLESPPTPPRGDRSQGFAEFWSSWPKKSGKKKALDRWRRMDAEQKERATQAAQAVAYAVANGYKDATYVPYGSTFLVSELYEDWFEDGEMVVPLDYARQGNGKLQAQVDRIAALAAEIWSTP